MSKLHEIEKNLISINEATFQNICDELLYNTQDNYPDIVRTGSTVGKQKTRKGTPDSYFILPNGRYILVEYTTKDAKDSKKAFLTKAKSDILKCLNVSKTKIEHKDIDKIIFCHNSKLTTQESQSLIAICSEKNVSLELKGLDSIALSLTGRCKYIAKEYLNISIDSGQILSPKVFVEEYENSGFATPLSNKLYGRESELSTLTKNFQESQITILSGAPGIGKSRLVLEAISTLKAANKKMMVYCLSNKSAPIHDDLRIYLSDDKPYLVFIDDGNRQSSNLHSLLGILKEKRKNKIHVVITVRDYALQGVKQDCKEYHTVEYNLKKLTDEQIDQILKGDDFKIANYRSRHRICDISNGNPRLAIMAAKVLITTQDLSSLNNVYNLYDKYFANAISNHEIFSENTLLKAIGILSFFYSVNLENSEHVDGICRAFSISPYDFKEALLKFEDWELAESNADSTVVRISDQVLSTYFFYRTFLRDKILDFNVLLDHYFEGYSHRLNDTVIAANSTFGYNDIINDIDPYLSRYWTTISNNRQIAMKFLKLFWLYRHEDLLEMADNIIATLPDVINANYTYNKEARNRGFAEKDEFLSLLSNCFGEIKLSYLDALELAFDYTAKKPECYQQLQDSIIEHLSIDIDDLGIKCERQQELFKFLVGKLNKGALYEPALFNTLPIMLSKSFRPYNTKRVNSQGRTVQRSNGIDTISDLRTIVWRFIILNYRSYKGKIDDFLLTYMDEVRDGVKIVYEFDFPFLARLFQKHFKKRYLPDVYILQNILYRLKRLGVKTTEGQKLSAQFMSSEYQVYLILSHNRLRDKEDLDFSNFQDYERLKEAEIRKSFTFRSLKDFRKFYKTFKRITLLKDRMIGSVFVSLDIILHEHSLHSPPLTFTFLQDIIKDRNPTTFNPLRWLSVLMEDKNRDLSIDYYQLIKTSQFNSRDFWQWFFYCNLPIDRINENYADDILFLLATTDSKLYVDFSVFEKFLQVRKNFYIDILLAILANKKSVTSELQIDFEFFDKYKHYYLNRVDLLKEVYFICDNGRNYFDHDCKHLLFVVQLDNSFFIEYITSVAKHSFSLHSKELEHLSIIWNLDNAEDLVEQALNYLLSRSMYFISDEVNLSFFKNLDANKEDRVINFLTDYLKRHIDDHKIISFVFYCVRNIFSAHWHHFILTFLSINADLEAFKKIELLNDHFSSNGDVIWADVRAEELQDILDAIETITVKKYKYNKHKTYLKDWINGEKLAANHERKIKFQYRDWH